jgi:LemA protein
MTRAVQIGIVVALLALLVLVIIAFIVSINRFVAQRGLMKNAWANVETELQRRYDLIPALVETVQGYAWHERATFEAVVQARAGAMRALAGSSADAQSAADTQLVGALRNLFAVAESHPQLRANENFLHFQQELATTEDRIQAARRFFNANVTEYNRRVRAFPSILIASLFGFHPAEFYQVNPVVHQMPGIRFNAPPPGAFQGAYQGAPYQGAPYQGNPYQDAPQPGPYGTAPYPAAGYQGGPQYGGPPQPPYQQPPPPGMGPTRQW